MTPLDFTYKLLIGWGGPDCFNQALSIANRGGVKEAAWDDTDHVITGKIEQPDGWEMPVRFEVLDDETIISHCPCMTNRKLGQVCPHVVALGFYLMVTMAPEEPKKQDGEDGAKDEPEVPRILVQATPSIRAFLSGSRVSLSIEILAYYGDKSYHCCETGPSDEIVGESEDEPGLFWTRNLPAEFAAMKLAKGYGFEPGYRKELSDKLFITDSRTVLNFLGSGLPYLRRHGWKIKLSPKLEATADSMPMIVPVVEIRDAPRGAFDVGYTFDAAGHDIEPAAIQTAINRGDSYIMTDGATLLLDLEAVESMRNVFADCSTSGEASPRHFRLGGIYAPYVKASLEALDAIDVEDSAAPVWRAAAASRNRDTNARLEPVPLGELETVLRPYQKQGVYWLRFLEKSGFSGILADEMGLGKTLQTLTWLSLERTDPASRGKPALVVCPTSLVANWAEEARKFVPQMRCLVVSGPDRAALFGRIPEADLVITSYALLQRDLEAAYEGRKFGAIVLDEAQHIKNRQTRNARAAKALDASLKLVLTGTPVENSVADVWSIFDFLLPGYLGDYESFKLSVEDPIAGGGKDGADAQEKLRHKLHPFILRRLKRDVAKDLPDKIVRTSFCPMTADQQRWYNRMLTDARGKIKGLVATKGFAKSRLEILALLMHLRQAASHLELLKAYRESGERSEEPSGKTEAFFELLDEAIDGGHRVLVFSQFVSMLSILRRELDARGIKYCYLDGSTKNRLDECRRFNSDASIPLFLISLRAGGTGLNLTGADMVIHFDPWWNPAVEDQATDRAHRIGQKKKVYVVKMIAQHSVEERVIALQHRKQLVIDATIGTTDAQTMENLTYDDIRAIVGL